MSTRPLFIPFDMSTVVHSFNSTAPTSFSSLTTLTLFSVSHWTTIKAIFRNVILSKTFENRNNLTYKRSTVVKYIQRRAPNGVFFVSDTGMKTHSSCVHGKGEKLHKPITILNAITNRVLPSFYKRRTPHQEVELVLNLFVYLFVSK